MPAIITEYPHFFTATNLEWKNLLQPDKYKDIVINSMRFLVQDGRVIIYGFVIMRNHIHLIWQMKSGHRPHDVQRDFLKYTAQSIKEDLTIHHPQVLAQFKVAAKDRQYQFWERNALSIAIWSEQVLEQKLRYIHQNPVRAGICHFPEQYKYSSVVLYHTGKDNWGFLTHCKG